jgi:hypothetical protein
MTDRNLWLVHCCETLTGVAGIVERFYKPEPGAAHNPGLHTDRPPLRRCQNTPAGHN